MSRIQLRLYVFVTNFDIKSDLEGCHGHIVIMRSRLRGPVWNDSDSI